MTPHPAAVASQEVRLTGHLGHVDWVRHFWGRGDQHLISLIPGPLDKGSLLPLAAGSRRKLSLLHELYYGLPRVILSSAAWLQETKDTTKPDYRIGSAVTTAGRPFCLHTGLSCLLDLAHQPCKGVIGGGLHGTVVCSLPSHGVNGSLLLRCITHSTPVPARAILNPALPSLHSGRRPMLSHFPGLSYSAAFPDPPAFTSASDPHLMHSTSTAVYASTYGTCWLAIQPSRPYR